MNQADTGALRGLLLMAGLCAAAYLLACVVLELAENARRAEVAVMRSDLAAYAVAEVLADAREILARAAEQRP